MRENEIIQTIRNRARRYINSPRLLVDYYRIRRTLAFPWPMDALPKVAFAVPLANYPWHIWLAWEIEERIAAIGWAAEIDADEGLRQRCRDDLLSIARWPSLSERPTPDLVLGHFLRIMLLAGRNWSWLGDDVQAKITAACAHALEQKANWLKDELPKIQAEDQVIATPSPDRERITQNIPLIGTIGLAMAADRARHPAAAALRDRARAILNARLSLSAQGITEAVAYDGYVLDFAADWMATLAADQRQALLDHPGVASTLAMSIDLAAPGHLMNVAHLSDVEPKEMPFHASAHAKLARMRHLPQSVWFLQHAQPEWLRTDALAAVQCLPDDANATAPPAVPTTGPYAVTLRSGFDADDVAVIIAAARSPMSHIHLDAGSIMIGHRGQWLISDPGYQQYLKKREREFTIGPRAHNCPVINGIAQTIKAAKVLQAGDIGGGVQCARIGLTACYTNDTQCQSIHRTVWLLPTKAIVLCDQIEGDVKKLEYFWHGHPSAGWWVDASRAVLHHDGADLWIACNRAALSAPQIDRQSGSRGHLTLQCELPPASAARTSCWWIFNVGPGPTDFTTAGTSLKIDGHELPIQP